MACACKGRSNTKYLWTSEPAEDGSVDSTIYDSEVRAKAKVLRHGGSYQPIRG